MKNHRFSLNCVGLNLVILAATFLALWRFDVTSAAPAAPAAAGFVSGAAIPVSANLDVRTKRETGATKFAVIVDAGSSGSRIYVYHYDSRDEVPDLKLVTVEAGESWNYKKEPGISTFADNLEGVDAYIGDLLEHLKDEVSEESFPREKWSTTPFMWFATAGMRCLDAADAEKLTNKIREVAKDKSIVPFDFVDRWARTLSGEEEGAFAWISLNYINGFFTQDGVEEHGVVETGGASAQMTFMVRGNILSNKFNVIIDRKVYPLYTHSFLYFGQDQIMKRIFLNECLCEKSKNADCKPCIVDGTVTKDPVVSACLIRGNKRNATLTHEGKDYDVALVGSGDPDQCAAEMDYLFRPDYTCFTKPCSFAGIYQPPFGIERKFYGTSAIRYAVKDLGLLKTTKDVTWPQVRKAADAYCSKDLSDIDLNDKYAWTRCLTGIFVAKEFEHLQFAEDHKITIQSFDTWTVGAVLYQLELMEILLPVTPDTGTPDTGNVSFQPSTAVLLISLIASLYGKSDLNLLFTKT